MNRECSKRFSGTDKEMFGPKINGHRFEVKPIHSFDKHNKYGQNAMKGSKERYLLGQKQNLYFWGVIPFTTTNMALCLVRVPFRRLILLIVLLLR